MPDLCILTRLHNSDTIEGYRRSMESLFNQTRQPERILILQNGNISDELRRQAIEFESTHSDVDIERIEPSVSRGEALRQGVAATDAELIAILDCGDVAVPERFERQTSHLLETQADVAGGYVAEFHGNPDDPHAIRTVPTTPEDIRAFAKYRSPVNHTTACIRRSALVDVGNYRAMSRMEDYDFWVRLLVADKSVRNMDIVLSMVDAGPELYERRGGTQYCRDEIQLLWRFYSSYRFYTFLEFLVNVVVRTPVRLFPTRIRAGLYRRFLRSQKP